MPCLRLQRYFQVPSKTSCRKPLPSAAAGCSQATPDQATASGFRSPLLGPCLSMVFRAAPELDRGTAGYCCRLASQGMESLLALAFTPVGRNNNVNRLLADESHKKSRRVGCDRREKICHNFVTVRTLSNVMKRYQKTSYVNVLIRDIL